ncbi:MAG TPA: SGNH/GDSL hydrolase family protein [Solirubrobacteraceae bacterium]|jgi:lysophospholipase L1-like esterase|nr:SGNH/GDSL hydrolase family protein [Solirubrobacteraceae bacterium]
MRRKLTICVALSALGCSVPGTALAKRTSKKKTPTSYYLSLGDSLSIGAQPDAQGTTLPTNQGYPNFLYSIEKRRIKGLKLEQLGCPGESTGSMINGGFCSYPAGSQLQAAVAFIAKHKIAFITLDIGANDIDSCGSITTGFIFTTTDIDAACVDRGIGSIATNAPTIAMDLRQAAGPKVKIAAMTYYDLFLADYLQGTTGQREASQSVSLTKSVNDTLSADFTAQNFLIGEVDTAFGVYTPFTTTVSTAMGTLPVAVSETCDLTWMCSAPPIGANIHATVAGYEKIAEVLAASLGAPGSPLLAGGSSPLQQP